MIRRNLSPLLVISLLLPGSFGAAGQVAIAADNANHPPGSQATSGQIPAKPAGNAKDLGPGGFQSKISDRNFSEKEKAAKLQAACTAYKKLAQTFLQGHNDEQALSYMDHTIIIAPKDPESYYLRAMALARLKRYDAAIDDIDKAIELYPKKVNEETKNCHALRLAVLQKQGQTTKVLDEQKKSADYLKGTQPPDISASPQSSPLTTNPMFENIQQKRWHPHSPLPMLDPTKRPRMPQTTPQP
jgi:tetratricopeptide (TPR) repeat protein